MKVKNIFKKNQIIIFALAIMIAIAGYLNFSRDKTKESELEEAASSSVNDLFADIDGDSYTDLADISEEDMASSETSTDDILLVNDPVSTEDNMVSKDGDKKDVADISEEEAEAATAEDTNPTEATSGEKSEVETTAPGEAILASTTISSAYFSTAKLTREQTRAKNTERLLDIISDTNTSQALKDKASEKLLDLNAIAEKESATEILLEAKGFSEAVVTIGEDVDVIVNSTSLTEQDRAIIEDVVMRKTGVEASNIVITNVVTED